MFSLYNLVPIQTGYRSFTIGMWSLFSD